MQHLLALYYKAIISAASKFSRFKFYGPKQIVKQSQQTTTRDFTCSVSEFTSSTGWIHVFPYVNSLDSVNKFSVSTRVYRFSHDDTYQWNHTISDPVRLVSNSFIIRDKRQDTCIHVNTHENILVEWYQLWTNMTRANWFRNGSLFAGVYVGIYPLLSYCTHLILLRPQLMFHMVWSWTHLNCPANKEPFLNQLAHIILVHNWYRSTSTCFHVYSRKYTCSACCHRFWTSLTQVVLCQNWYSFSGTCYHVKNVNWASWTR